MPKLSLSHHTYKQNRLTGFFSRRTRFRVRCTGCSRWFRCSCCTTILPFLTVIPSSSRCPYCSSYPSVPLCYFRVHVVLIVLIVPVDENNGIGIKKQQYELKIMTDSQVGMNFFGQIGIAYFNG